MYDGGGRYVVICESPAGAAERQLINPGVGVWAAGQVERLGRGKSQPVAVNVNQRYEFTLPNQGPARRRHNGRL